MNIKKLSVTLVSLSIFFIVGLVMVYAADDGGGGGAGGGNPGGGNPIVIGLKNPFSGGDSLFALMRSIINNVIMPIGGVLAVLAFIYSGFLYVTAQGDTKKISDAHRALLYTAIGTAILLGAWVLANVICQTIVQLGAPITCPS